MHAHKSNQISLVHTHTHTHADTHSLLYICTRAKFHKDLVECWRDHGAESAVNLGFGKIWTWLENGLASHDPHKLIIRPQLPTAALGAAMLVYLDTKCH